MSFIIGNFPFIASLVLYAATTLNFLNTEKEELIINGMFKYLRHPMQMLSIIMWIGVGIAALSWIFIITGCRRSNTYSGVFDCRTAVSFSALCIKQCRMSI